MGMCCSFTSISTETLGKILLYPPVLWKVVAPDDEEIFEEAVADYKPGFAVRLLELLGAKRNDVFDFEPTEDEGQYFDIDKAWHGIHYMLTGSAVKGPSPYNFLLVGGHTIKGTEDCYRVFKPAEVKEISKALASISKEEFESRFDPVKMMEEDIYPNIWNRSKEEDDTLGYLSENFTGLKRYLESLADSKMGMIVGLS